MMARTKHRPRKWFVSVGEEHCFHTGNRVAIVECGKDQGESWEVTIAEVWPGTAGIDVKDAKLIVRLVNKYFKETYGTN